MECAHTFGREAHARARGANGRWVLMVVKLLAAESPERHCARGSFRLKRKWHGGANPDAADSSSNVDRL